MAPWQPGLIRKYRERTGADETAEFSDTIDRTVRLTKVGKRLVPEYYSSRALLAVQTLTLMALAEQKLAPRG